MPTPKGEAAKSLQSLSPFFLNVAFLLSGGGGRGERKVLALPGALASPTVERWETPSSTPGLTTGLGLSFPQNQGSLLCAPYSATAPRQLRERERGWGQVQCIYVRYSDGGHDIYITRHGYLCNIGCGMSVLTWLLCVCTPSQLGSHISPPRVHTRGAAPCV